MDIDPRDGRAGYRSGPTALEKIRYCLDRLRESEEADIQDEVVHDLTIEEVAGALLHARDEMMWLLEFQGDEPGTAISVRRLRYVLYDEENGWRHPVGEVIERRAENGKLKLDDVPPREVSVLKHGLDYAHEELRKKIQMEDDMTEFYNGRTMN